MAAGSTAADDDEVRPVPVAALARPADLAGLAFTTTAELEPLPGLAGQERADEALDFGVEIRQRGFNIFAIGSGAARIPASVRALLEDVATARPAPPEWVYVNNFATPHRPQAIALPAGRAVAFQQAVRALVEDLKIALPKMFEGEDYQKRRGAIEQEARQRHEQAFAALNEKAMARGIAILRTPMGFGMAPVRDGKVVPPPEFNAWPEVDQQAARAAIEELEKELEEAVRGLPRLEKEARAAMAELDRETARAAIAEPLDELAAAFSDIPAVAAHAGRMREDMLENVRLFFAPENEAERAALAALRMGGPLERYDVNVLVTRPEGDGGAPVVEELHPTLSNLLGRIEYTQLQGALVTNFRLIKPGALHRANGGILLLDARSLLTEAFSWPALKRALLKGEIAIEDVARFVGLTTTVSLDPDPIPLDLKVVLCGERILYYLLSSLDPEFAQHFKVLADFDDDMPRTAENEALLARLIGAIAGRNGMRPMDRGAVARAVEQAARLSGDAARLTLLTERLHDLVAEASHVAGAAGRAVVGRDDVDAAIARQVRRASRIRERSREMVLRDIARIETTGSRVGQINGLSVLTLGEHAFGQPARITCRVRPGAGRIVDIEREAKLGGNLHSKGVLILSGYLGGRFALERPMSLHASLVFEQSYGGVDGDSASSTELYALISALAEVPLRQDLAVTGSVDQHGIVQAIGGVNEKIEGFFEVCAARGLTGTQGVLIPAANVQHLMLRADVVAACAAGRFAVYPIRTIDEGLALLTGRPSGARDADGQFPEGSTNALVEARIAAFSKVRREAGAGPGDGAEPGRERT